MAQPREAKDMGDGTWVLYFLGERWSTFRLVHSLCGDGRLDPLLPGVLGQLSGAQPTTQPQSFILILWMKEMAPKLTRVGDNGGGGLDNT